VVFFALEMARRELDERTLSQLSHLDGDGIAYKDMNGDTLGAAASAPAAGVGGAGPVQLHHRRQPGPVGGLRAPPGAGLKQRGPLAAVFIDYLQIMDRPDAKGRNEASVIGEMTKGLKQLAREAETCVVLLSQINRGVESRDDKRPQLSDLRESGAIEQDANAVLFPYREAYYLERAEPKDVRKKRGLGDGQVRRDAPSAWT
jgi:replicative DNA helicase